MLLMFGGVCVRSGPWDSWVPGGGTLGDHALTPIRLLDWNLFVHNFTVQDDWDWSTLRQLLPADICTRIASIKPPCPGADDFPIWQHSNDGYFSIKSAYLHLFNDLNGDPPHFPFRLIWKLKTPPRVNTFLWHVAHNRLMTNATRFKRGISDSASYPWCQQQDESIMHVLRDCEGTLEMWESIVDPNQWHRFASLGLHQWLEFNLKTDVGVGRCLELAHCLWLYVSHVVD